MIEVTSYILAALEFAVSDSRCRLFSAFARDQDQDPRGLSLSGNSKWGLNAVSSCLIFLCKHRNTVFVRQHETNLAEEASMSTEFSRQPAADR
jgi:hypothetical protein